jgi:capsular polysaccharide transport system permease protein
MAGAALPGRSLVNQRWRRALRSQYNVFWALFFREADSRRGRRFALGYLAAGIEPLIIVGTIGTVFSVLDRTPPFGPSLILFLGTGVFPVYLFIHTSMRLRQALAPGAHRNRYPIEGSLDHVAVHAVLHIFSSFVVAVLFFAAMYYLGVRAAMPWNPIVAFEALLTIFMFGVGMGIVNSVVARIFPVWDVFWPAFARASLHFSGPYFVAAYLPPNIRWYFGLNPVMHAVNWFRDAFYFFYPKQLTTPLYPLSVAVISIVVGLLLEAGTRRYLEDKE